jgi:hypothetical protein
VRRGEVGHRAARREPNPGDVHEEQEQEQLRQAIHSLFTYRTLLACEAEKPYTTRSSGGLDSDRMTSRHFLLAHTLLLFYALALYCWYQYYAVSNIRAKVK